MGNINNECIICFEKSKEDEPLGLIKDIEIVNCVCKVWVHERCINEWFRIKQRCPYCQTDIQTVNPLLRDDYINSHSNRVVIEHTRDRTNSSCKCYCMLIISIIFIFIIIRSL